LLSLVLVTLVAQTARAQDPEQALSALDSLLNVPVSAAAKYAQRRSEAPASITIVTAEEVRRYGYRTLADVLNDLPGFYVSNDHNYTYVGVRGFGRPADFNNRVLVQINGHTLNESFVGAVGIGREFGIDLDAIERIEIVRGPGSSLHGARAMFAVVNLVTRDGRAIEGFETTGELGNLGTWRT
jgi:iron complex outermembrane receptor protein